MSSRSVAEIAANFGENLRQVTDPGETITVTSGGVPIAELRPVAKARTVGEFLDRIQSLPPLEPDERVRHSRATSKQRTPN